MSTRVRHLGSVVVAFIVVAAFILASIPVVSAQEGEQTFTLRILHTNDHHAHLETVDVRKVGELGGIARRKTLVDQLRADSTAIGEPLLLLDAGDVFQGTLYFNQYLGQADLYFYNELGYDAMAVGNHEYDRGQQPLVDFIDGANFPLLSANTTIDASSPLSGKIKPWIIKEINGEQVGIFGLTTAETGVLSSPGEGITFTDSVAAAEQAVSELSAQGVNKIIALTHLGINEEKQVAQNVSGIDIVIGGHSHTPLGNQPGATEAYPIVFNKPGEAPTLYVTDWEWGLYLGDIRLVFDAQGSLVYWEGEPKSIDDTITPDAAFEAKLNEYKAPLETLRNTVIGQAAVDLDGARSNVRSRETNLSNLITDAMLNRASSDGAQIVITNGGGIRTSIPAGDVTIGQVLEVLPFGNTIALVTLTGAQIQEALENGLSQVEDVAGRFPQIAGMRFVWNPAAASGSRVVDMQLRNADGSYSSIDPNATYRVATNNYMLGGGDGYEVFEQGSEQLDTGYIMADEVMDYIQANSPVSPSVDGRIVEGDQPFDQGAATPATLPNTNEAPVLPLAAIVIIAAAMVLGGITLRQARR